MLSHMRGLKEMIRLKGGFGRLTDQITAWVVIMCEIPIPYSTID
jgi:hypothetical protein